MTPTALEQYLHSSIPVSGLMGIKVESCDDREIILSAPLSINHNHLGTAFGGSLAVLTTLSGYCALWTALGNKDAHIVIRRSNIEYVRPITGDIRATCKLPDQGISESFSKQFQKHGKARLSLDATIEENGSECVRFTGEFVALGKSS